MRVILKSGMQNKTFEMPIYSPGKQAELHTGETVTIEHVHVRGYSLAVKVVGKKDLIPVQNLRLKSTMFQLNSS